MTFQEEEFLHKVVNVVINNTLPRQTKDEILLFHYHRECLNETMPNMNGERGPRKIVFNNTMSLEIEIKVESEDRTNAATESESDLLTLADDTLSTVAFTQSSPDLPIAAVEAEGSNEELRTESTLEISTDLMTSTDTITQTDSNHSSIYNI